MSGKPCKPWGLNRGITRLYDCKTAHNETIDKKAIKDEFITVLKTAFDDAFDNYRPRKDRRTFARAKKAAAATTTAAPKTRAASSKTRVSPRTKASSPPKTFAATQAPSGFATFKTGEGSFRGTIPTFTNNTRRM